MNQPLVAGLALMMLSPAGYAGTLYGVEYSRPGGQSLQFDARIPEGTGPFPAAIVVHGGAWVTGDRKRSVEPLFDPLTRAGIASFSISYRLASVADMDSVAGALSSVGVLNHATDDVRQAVAFVREHAAEYNIDPARIALIGESAGAQLASMAALKNGTQPPVQAVVAFYSPSDLVSIVQNSPRFAGPLREQLRGTPLEAMIAGVLHDLSPIAWIHADEPPFLLIHGTKDTLVPFQQSKDFCAVAQKAGAACELLGVDQGGHGMLWWESIAAQRTYKAPMIQWLRERFNLK